MPLTGLIFMYFSAPIRMNPIRIQNILLFISLTPVYFLAFSSA